MLLKSLKSKWSFILFYTFLRTDCSCLGYHVAESNHNNMLDKKSDEIPLESNEFMIETNFDKVEGAGESPGPLIDVVANPTMAVNKSLTNVQSSGPLFEVEVVEKLPKGS